MVGVQDDDLSMSGCTSCSRFQRLGGVYFLGERMESGRRCVNVSVIVGGIVYCRIKYNLWLLLRISRWLVFYKDILTKSESDCIDIFPPHIYTHIYIRGTPCNNFSRLDYLKS